MGGLLAQWTKSRTNTKKTSWTSFVELKKTEKCSCSFCYRPGIFPAVSIFTHYCYFWNWCKGGWAKWLKSRTNTKLLKFSSLQATSCRRIVLITCNYYLDNSCTFKTVKFSIWTMNGTVRNIKFCQMYLYLFILHALNDVPVPVWPRRRAPRSSWLRPDTFMLLSIF